MSVRQLLRHRASTGSVPTGITRVEPRVVAEVTADTALQAGKLRHALRYLRHRPDMDSDRRPTSGTTGLGVSCPENVMAGPGPTVGVTGHTEHASTESGSSRER